MTQYTKPTPLPAWAESAGGADVLQPSDAEIQAGWPLTSVPPSRKRFNWILKYLAQGVRYLMQMGIPLWDAAEDYPANARVMGSNGKTYKALQTSINQNPTTATAYWQVWGTEGRDDQLQLTTAFTTAGTAPNFTLTPSPAPAALTANLRFRVKFHVAGAGSDVINIGGLGNKSLKQFDLSGAKVPANIRANQLADIEYDGTDLIILDPLPAGLGSFLVSIGATTTLTFQDVGKSFIGGSGSAFTVTLPLASACPTGSRISFANFNAGKMTVSRQGTDNINNGTSNTSIVLGIGGILEVECLSSGQWYVTKIVGIGVDQVWQTVTGSRVLSTTYTNTSGKPLTANVRLSASVLTVGTATVQGQGACQCTVTTGMDGTLTFIVPPGGTYSVAAPSCTLNSWFELS